MRLLRRRTPLAPPSAPPPSTTLAQGAGVYNAVLKGPTCGLCLRSAPGTASVYKMRLRADHLSLYSLQVLQVIDHTAA